MNTELVIEILASRWIRKFPSRSLYTRDDLVQEGWLAHFKAELTFDEDTGTKFSTFLYTVVTVHFRDLLRAEFNNKSVDDPIYERGSTADNPEHMLELAQALKALSSVSEEFVSMIVDGVQDDLVTTIRCKKRQMSTRRGWSALNNIIEPDLQLFEVYFGVPIEKLASIFYNYV